MTVDLLSTGFDAPDVKNIAFVRPLKSAILYKQMKGRGTRLCEDIDKRYFMIFDYTGASGLEDTEFDGHPANVQKPARASKPKGRKPVEPTEKPVGDGVAGLHRAIGALRLPRGRPARSLSRNTARRRGR